MPERHAHLLELIPEVDVRPFVVDSRLAPRAVQCCVHLEEPSEAYILIVPRCSDPCADDGVWVAKALEPNGEIVRVLLVGAKHERSVVQPELCEATEM